MANEAQSLVECVYGGSIDLAEAIYAEVDGIPMLRRCKIIGDTSQNDRYYTSNALEGAVPLYEDVNVNINHPSDPHKSRDFQDRFGWLTNVVMEDGGDGKRYPFGNLCFNPKHPWAETALWWAKHRPKSMGLSHNAVGQGRDDNGKFIVEKIVKVRSVDLVADPATTKSLFEAIDMAAAKPAVAPKPAVQKPVKEEDDKPKEEPKPEEPKVEEPKPEEPKEPEKPAGQTLEHQIGHLIITIVKNPDLSRAEKQKRVLAGLKILPDMAGDEPKDAPKDAPPDVPPVVEESVKPKPVEPSLMELCEAVMKRVDSAHEKYALELDSIKAHNAYMANVAKARQFCLEAKLPNEVVSDVFLQECALAGSDEKMKLFVKDRATVLDVKEAVAPVHAQFKEKPKAATDVKVFVECVNK